MLSEVTAALAAIRPEGTFAAELACGSEGLHIDAAGLGRIRFPISAATAQRLRAIARPAPFGRRDQTLHDKKVRNTWEIEARLLKIDQRRWRPALDAQLAILQQRLGLSPGGALEATLDKMLVYEPGQFFAPHQDSERSDDMVGSLVVTLPSTSTGGHVVVEHHKEKKIFRGAKRGPTDLSLLAFYADCHHEVKPITSGWRVVLTYQLRYATKAGRPAPVKLSAASVDRLTASVEAYFETPVAPPYGQAAPQRPDRLIYLLDHEYTPKSLAWGRLKNADRARAFALRQAAERLDCECFLALADVHESWQCEDEGWSGRYGRRRWRDRYDDDDEDDDEGYRLVDLIEREVELQHWVGVDGQSAPDTPVIPSRDEICFTKASSELSPFKSEHEGYMGNYGNTADRWYHRAALVMWPRERDFVIRAKASPAWAVGQLDALVKARAVPEARDRARSLLPFWRGAFYRNDDKTFATKLFKVLLALNDADLARDLLAPLGPRSLGARAAPAFAALVDAYGLAWAQQIFSAWLERMHVHEPTWATHLPPLCEALLAHAPRHGRAFAEWLLAQEVASFKRRHVASLRWITAQESEEKPGPLIDHVLALVESAAMLEAAKARDELLAFVTAAKTALPLMTAGALLRQCRERRTPAALRALGIGPLVRHVEGELDRLLALPRRSKDDWSIDPPTECTCDLCRQLATFLRDRQRIEYQWPLAENNRQHIHSIINRHGLPVTHTTTRQGRPYTLVLRKQPALFQLDAARREKQTELSRWLKKERRALTGGAERPTAAKKSTASGVEYSPAAKKSTAKRSTKAR